MQTDELRDYLNANWQTLRKEILEGNYKPQPVRKVEIPKPQGGTRMLGIPTVTDRLLQQAIAQWLSPKNEEEFSNYSYGFRPKRNAHQAVLQAQTYLNDGYEYVIELDLEKFFDKVNHDKLMGLLAKQIADKRTLKLIRSYLTSGIMEGGVASPRTEGTPQGSPLTPRTYPLTLNFLGEYQLKEGNFNYFIKSITFMINGKVSEYGTGKTYQPRLCFIEERETSISGDRALDEEVWCVANSGVPLCSASQRDEEKNGYTGSICGIYCQNTSQPDHQDKKARKFQRDVYQHSSQSSTGRFFSKKRSWPKKRGKLKYHSPTIGCGSKSSLRFTIFSCQPIIKLFKLNIALMN